MSDDKTCDCSGRASARREDTESVVADAREKFAAPLVHSVFRIPGMDCPAEEQMVRLRLADAPVVTMAFDLPDRILTVDHAGKASELLQRLEPLGYGAELLESKPLEVSDAAMLCPDDAAEARVLRMLLGINAIMFVVEIIAGWWAGSAGLISDAADMFADAAIYTVAIYAVGRELRHKRSAARLSGVLQLLLALGALAETGRRMMSGSFPEEFTMVGISLLALIANVACLILISRHRNDGIHMRASYIFSANDVLANLGVIVAGLLVAWTASPWPDWTIGLVIGGMVLIGALRILRLK